MDRNPAIRPGTRLVVEMASLAILSWGLFLFIDRWWVAVLPLVFPTIGALLNTCRGRDSQQRVADAIGQHRDPGPAWRDQADRAAATTAGMPGWKTWQDAWLLAAAGVAGLVLAIVLRDVWLLGPTVASAGLVVLQVVLLRRARSAAARWLADPPPRTAVEQPTS